MMAHRDAPPTTPQEGELRGFLVDAVRPALIMVIKWIERKYRLDPACAECRRRRGR